MKARRNYDVEVFIKAWQAAPSAKQCAWDLGIDYVVARSRASYLRGLGIPLKRFSSERFKAGEIPALAELARAAGGGR